MRKIEYAIIRPHYQGASRFCVPYSFAHVLETIFTDAESELVRVSPLPLVVKAFRARGFKNVFDRSIAAEAVLDGINKYGTNARLGSSRIIEIKKCKMISKEKPSYEDVINYLTKSPILAYREPAHAIAITAADFDKQVFTVIDPQHRGGYKDIPVSKLIPRLLEIFAIFPLKFTITT